MPRPKKEQAASETPSPTLNAGAVIEVADGVASSATNAAIMKMRVHFSKVVESVMRRKASGKFELSPRQSKARFGIAFETHRDDAGRLIIAMQASEELPLSAPEEFSFGADAPLPSPAPTEPASA